MTEETALPNIPGFIDTPEALPVEAPAVMRGPSIPGFLPSAEIPQIPSQAVIPGYVSEEELSLDTPRIPPIKSPEAGLYKPENWPTDAKPAEEDPSYLKAAGDKFLEGMGGMVADTVEGLNVLTLDTDGSELAARIRELTRAEPEEAFEDSFFINTFMPGLGSTIPFFAGGAVGAGIKGAAAGAAWVIPAFLGGASQSGSGFHDAMSNGASYEQSLAGWGLNIPLGMLEALPVSRVFGRVDDIVGGGLSKAVANNIGKAFPNLPATKWTSDMFQIARSGAYSAIEEGLQETAQSVGENVIAAGIWDSTRNWNDHVVQAAAGGGSVGMLLGTLAGAFGVKLRRGQDRRIRQEIAEQEAFFIAEPIPSEPSVAQEGILGLFEEEIEAVTQEQKVPAKPINLTASADPILHDGAAIFQAFEEGTQVVWTAGTLPWAEGERAAGHEGEMAKKKQEARKAATKKIEAVAQRLSRKRPSRKPPPLVARDSSPILPPGTRWESDRGAMPGEPFATLDGGKAALIEHPAEGTDLSHIEAVLPGGQSLGIFSTVADAAAAAEQGGLISKMLVSPGAGSGITEYQLSDVLAEKLGTSTILKLDLNFNKLDDAVIDEFLGEKQAVKKVTEELVEAATREIVPTTVSPTTEAKTGQPITTVGYHGTPVPFEGAPSTEFGGVRFDSAVSQGAAFYSSSQEVAAGYSRLPQSENEGHTDFDSNLIRTRIEELNGRDIEEQLIQETDPERKADLQRQWDEVTQQARATGAERVIASTISFKNPLVVDSQGTFYDEETYAGWAKEAEAGKHDGLIIKNIGETEDNLDLTADTIVVFKDASVSEKIAELAKERIPEDTPIEALMTNGNKLPPGDPKMEDPNGVFESFNTDQDKFNKAYYWAANILQIARVNEHIAPLQNYVGLMEAWDAARSRGQYEVEETYSAWQKLGPEQEQIVTNILLEESAEKKFLKPEELEARGMSEEGKLVYDKVRGNMVTVLEKMEALLKDAAQRRFSDNVVEAEKEKAEIGVKFAKMKKLPYFPFMRFGKHGVRILDRDGKQIWFGSFEKERNQKKALRQWREDIRKDPARQGQKAVRFAMTDFHGAIQSFPGDFAQLVKDRMKSLKMDLTKDQEEALLDLSYEQNTAKGFLKRFMKRKGVAGYSRDGLRIYASYMSSAISFMARVEYAPQLLEEIHDLRAQDKYIKSQAPGQGQASDLSKRGEIANWLEDHLKYTMSPQNELAALRSGIFTWFLGFNVKSAVLNSTQMIYTTYPYLAARFGSDIEAAAAMGKAMAYQSKKKIGGEDLNPEWERMIARGMKENWLDEGLATNLAVYKKSDRLNRVFTKGRDSVQSWLMKVPGWSAWMFHGVEKMNRHITGLAAYQLARNDGKDEEASIQEAKNAVRRTQFEYARWNRPKFMRGKPSIIFVFQNYVQNMLWFSVKEQGAMRYWFIQAILAGALGLPGAEDFLDLVDASWPSIRKYLGMKGPYKASRVEMRRFLNDAVGELGVNPDILLHGVSRSTMGLGMIPVLDRMPMPRFDLSGSLSMGDIIPGTEILRGIKNGNLDQTLARGSADVAGATGSAVYNVLRAVFDNDPDSWKRWERALPAAARNAHKAVRLARDGGEFTRDDALVASFNIQDSRDRADLLALAVGFQPEKLSAGWEEKISQIQNTEYYRKWKTEILTDFNYTWSIDNREGRSDVMKAIKEYNRLIPFPEMAITNKTLKRSRNSYLRIRARTSNDIALQNEYIRLQRDVAEAFVGSEAEDNQGNEIVVPAESFVPIGGQ